jgi:membrane protease YdiL (CAAX protease family)
LTLEQSLKDFYYFLCNPVFDYKRSQPIPLLSVTLMFFIIFFFEMIVAGTLFSLIDMDESNHKLTDMLENMSYWKMFLLAVILAPFFEEIIFRFHLRYPRMVIYLILMGTMGLVGYLYKIEYLSLRICVASITLLTAMTLIVSFNTQLLLKLKSIVVKQFGFVFYLTVVIFSYVHIFNFNEITEWYYTPILVFPQFVIALYLGYIRVRNNIAHSIFVHSMNNAIPMLLMLLIPEGAI